MGLPTFCLRCGGPMDRDSTNATCRMCGERLGPPFDDERLSPDAAAIVAALEGHQRSGPGLMMGLPRILCGGPTREESSLVFQAHRAGLEAQAADGFEMAVRHMIVDDPGGPRWHMDKIGRVAESRQYFMDEAVGERALSTSRYFDALLMVDSDVILGPGVLSRMWAVDAPVVFGVYWTYADWGGRMDYWPQVWDAHPYRFTPECWAALKAEGVNEVPVLGGGACTLIRGRGFESRYWPLLKSLQHAGGIWPGEDRSYCLGLECRGIPMVAVTNLPIHHCYDIKDQTRPALERIRAKVGL